MQTFALKVDLCKPYQLLLLLAPDNSFLPYVRAFAFICSKDRPIIFLLT